MVVDNRTGLQDIVKDIQKGMLNLGNCSKLLLLVSRADFQRKSSLSWVLERFQKAIQQKKWSMVCWISGPLPRAHDNNATCATLMQEGHEVQMLLRRERQFHYVFAAEALMDRVGVIQELFKQNGTLSLNGIDELRKACATC